MKTVLIPQDHTQFFSSCVALGNFDGVHRGHQLLIRTCETLAKEHNLSSIVYTFFKHHRAYFGNFHEVITENSAKEYVINKLFDVDFLAFQTLDDAFLNQTPEQFVKTVLKDTLHAKIVTVGEHYSFGKGGAGDATLLKSLCENEGIKVVIVPLMTENGEMLSSTAVRRAVQCGDMDKANRILGYDFFMAGTIVHGNHIGSTIGFPTVNVVPAPDQLLPRFGVYATKTVIENKEYDGVTNIGLKPTIGSDRPVAETHLFAVHSDLYGKTAHVKFIKMLRPEQKFASIEELKAQIARDKEHAKAYLGTDKTE